MRKGSRHKGIKTVRIPSSEGIQQLKGSECLRLPEEKMTECGVGQKWALDKEVGEPKLGVLENLSDFETRTFVGIFFVLGTEENLKALHVVQQTENSTHEGWK